MLLVGNGRVITRDAQIPFLEDGCVCIKENLILEVGDTQEMKAKYPDAKFLDANGGVIMPGLINAHNHIYSAMARGLSIRGYSPKDFMDILEGQWWKLDRLLDLEEISYSAWATYIDCVKNGVTTVFDHHASFGAIRDSLFAISDVAKKLGIRTCLCYEVSDRDGVEKRKEAVLENEAFILYAQKDETDMQKGMMGMHAPFTLSDETIAFCAEHKPDTVGYHIHVAEGLDDVYDSLQKYGKRTINRLFDLGVLGPKTIAVHCVHINQQEMELLKHTDTMVVHNPESNMGNAVGCGPVLEFMRHGILTGLGTDGYTNDMIESYKVGNIIHKHHLNNPNVAWGEIPTMLFENNAKIAARYYQKPLGVLKPGAYADVIVADYDPLTPMHEGNVNSHILFGMNGRSVTTTIINGKVVMENRRLVGVDEAAIMAKSRESAAKLWNKING